MSKLTLSSPEVVQDLEGVLSDALFLLVDARATELAGDVLGIVAGLNTALSVTDNGYHHEVSYLVEDIYKTREQGKDITEAQAKRAYDLAQEPLRR